MELLFAIPIVLMILIYKLIKFVLIIAMITSPIWFALLIIWAVNGWKP